MHSELGGAAYLERVICKNVFDSHGSGLLYNLGESGKSLTELSRPQYFKVVIIGILRVVAGNITEYQCDWVTWLRCGR